MGTRVTKADAVAVGSVRRVDVTSADGIVVPVALVRDDNGNFHAIGDTCTHGQVSLSEGDLEGCAIECWAHGSQFDLETGQPHNLPATEPVPVYSVTILDGDVVIDITTHPSS